ncbi:ATP-binding protein [Chelatococcus sp. GCM10030263]|uniref:PAS domain-containing hybrid sensor histidine kinase/response regulator n=1 Tax=Chelatococcus sp. GCM10030263 TaxID=3273387 RepID=UPI003612ECB9
MTDRPSPPAPDTVQRAEDYEDLYENAPCGYLSAQPDGRICKVNRTLAHWLGHEPEALIGRRFQDLLNIAGKIYYDTHFAPLLRMQGFFNEVALDLVAADGQRVPVLVNAQERRDENGGLLFIRITVFNATDRRRYERELLAARQAALAANEELAALNAHLEERVAAEVDQRIKAEDALRQAQKMEAIGQLTGGVAHDFNNLLTVVMGGLDTIGRQLAKATDGPDLARIGRARELAMQGAQRAATLTARLLAFSRRQPLDPKPIDANRLVADLAAILKRTLGEPVALEVVEAAGLWRTQADPNELENALLNLAVNARDAMPNGGRLTIETANAFLDEAYVEGIPEPVPPGQYVLIAVSDSGTGMDPETMTRVFEPFFTTKPAGKGTGLGLSQVYGFVRQSGGHVRIYSELGQGTTVKIYLPRLHGVADRAEATAAAPVPAHRGANETILLVEDDDHVRAFATEALRELGYRVIEATTGPQALAALDAEPVDLLFTDVVLPEGMNGRELADAARTRRPELKVLFTTGYARNAIVHHGRLDPDVELLAKPFTYEALAAKIRKLLEAD